MIYENCCKSKKYIKKYLLKIFYVIFICKLFLLFVLFYIMDRPHVLNQFQGIKGDFAINFQIITSLFGVHLHISLVNQTTFKKYEQTIDSRYLEQHDNLITYFETPQELFTYLTQKFDELAITPQGQIKFTLQINKVLNKKKDFTINTIVKQQGKVQVLEMRVARLQRQLQREKEVNAERIRYMAMDNVTLKEKLIGLQQKLQGLLKNGNNILISQGMSQQEKQGHLTNHVQNKDEQIDCRVFLRDQNIIGQIIKITEPQGSQYRSWVGGRGIDKTIRYRISRHKITNNSLWLGVGNIGVFQFVNFHSKNFISYNFNNKSVCVNGQVGIFDHNLRENSIIQFQCDRVTHRVSWWVDQKLITSQSIPQFMRSQLLYMVIFLKHKNDAIELEIP